jgi:hypothetical protein
MLGVADFDDGTLAFEYSAFVPSFVLAFVAFVAFVAPF